MKITKKGGAIMNKKTDTLAIQCPIDIHDKIRAAAKKENMTIKDWLLRACMEKLPPAAKKRSKK
jgi:uncharacterized protein (DUF1778 family)